MASYFMRIDGVDVKGGATVKGLEGNGWFAINYYHWSAVRSVAMDIGNGNNADSGMVALSEVTISKKTDGATGDLLSFLFSPGKEGKTVEVAITQPEVDGSGAQVITQVKLSNARLVSYVLTGTDGSLLAENISLSYVEISYKNNYELEGGEIKEGGIVTYNLPQGKLLSGSK